MANWKQFLEQEKTKPYFQNLMTFLKDQIAKGKEIYPQKEFWLRSLQLCPLENVQVVFLGQDPYHTPGVADGLAFSTKQEKLPPSLKNIFQEVKNCYPDFEISNGDLSPWAKQGVLLMNRVLTVEKSLPTSHYDKGWETFSKNALTFLIENKQDVVFVLLGNKAQNLVQEIDLSKQKVIELAHPSPFSAHRGFLGSNLFLTINGLVKTKIKF